MSHYKPYPSYKDSGVDWLGEVPEHWELKPLFSLYRKTKRAGYPDEELLSVYRDHGVVKKSSRDDNNNRPSDDLSNYQLVEPSDLVTNKMKTWQGSIAVSCLRGIVSPAYFVYSVEHEQNDRYIHHLLRCDRYVAGYLSSSKGIRVNQWDLDQDLFRRFPVILPSSEEQQAIATFLDRETALIDALIEKKQRQIELLKEKRQAIITEAVTKGLDPDVLMKDSGVAWLGEVPEHWGINKLGYIGRCQNGINIGAEYFGSGFPFVSYGDVYNNKALPQKVNGLVQSSKEDRRTYSVKGGDVFFTRTSEILDEIAFSSVCLKTINNATFAGFLIRFRPEKNRLDKRFSKYYFQNQLLRAFFNKEMNLVTRASLSQDLLKKMPVLKPSLKEQAKIVECLDNKTSIIDEIVEKSIKSIGLLKERRSALITAAVTGQIDVRGE